MIERQSEAPELEFERDEQKKNFILKRIPGVSDLKITTLPPGSTSSNTASVSNCPSEERKTGIVIIG